MPMFTAEETPRHGHAPIKMHDVGRSMRLRKVGEYYFVDNEITGARAMWLCIPSKFRIEGFERVRLPIGADGWQWDGNVETPTLKPSVHTFGHWHGWVRNGFLVEA